MDFKLNRKIFTYSLTVKETYLDSFSHVNNAAYLMLFEEARWDFINNNGYGIKKIKETGLGPTILHIDISFSKELKARDEIIIESETISYKKKIGKLVQRILRSGEVCCTAEFTIGLFDVNQRKLVLPTDEWLKAIGIMDTESHNKFE